MAEPFYVAGTGRTCTRLMQAAPGRIFAKTGAEGVFAAIIPEQGIAVAVKADDGAARAADTVVAGTLARFFASEPEIHERLMAIAERSFRNWNGMEVGAIRLAPAFG